MSITSNDLRPGIAIVFDNDPWQVVEFQHVKPGKGAAFVRSKLKNMRTGNVRENTFRAGEKLEKADIEKKAMQYLYQDGDQYNFMDNETFEQLPVHKDLINDRVLKYMKESLEYDMLFFNGSLITIDPPNFIVAEITETDPGLKGDTATGGTKPATIETGAVIQVPLFVNQGDKIRVDTRTDSYLERA
ncbi:elongation factor P [bacterium (Candidatus Blackallbacteria) CG17_big_fil_post_rev_8_21_14_2_50_48_46]|uniref:Elongation factor P n=1 Tax=bacterium (Candidatus Blackallbacteria) CG17_big_fil_post_rev_8_21_14_2_50_48_46 TaxID=2014261 RepID=A0A2M7G0I5_9BACT|nr:MAG: elongation factor P [bacterium (Candidatus Blackallbacteria) CG18_big_fil_WC_8_21_14_2_50_49_26]PIW14742.1 MAG: elongation factor P [bacterium (Candidatus Blackallbacteria) CG17_big_fil_post_rev_8_21_14_2_50_48_46]PIW50844.1 MAG: elongation factor P [bacterium (Candidatus Blackallbacteria) CG13_big_fil_rev_8_21_14_2_50_49_14]